jgi:hypothetical protein
MRAPTIAGIVAAGALLTTAFFFGDGTSGGRLFWIGSLSVIAAVVLLWAGPVPVPRAYGAAALALLAALTLWVGLTMWWSIAPDLSWAAFDRLLAYGALAVLGLLCARATRPARTVAAGLAVLLGLVLAWALLGKVVPSLFTDGARVARLRDPVGYWNSLALVAATAVPFGLWAAGSRRHHAGARAAGAFLVYLAEIAVVLTYSRAGIAVTAVAAVAWLAVDRNRLETLATLVLVTPVAGLVSLWAFSRPALTDDLQPYQSRVDDGAWFGVLLVVGAAIVVGVAWYAAGIELSPERRRSLTRTLGIVVAIAAVAAVAVIGVRKGGTILDEFRGTGTAEVTQSPNRLADLSSSNRWTWWKEAWQLFTDAPAGGKGAATFEIARRPIRVGSIVTTEPHALPLQFLAETGIVGFLLLLGLIGAGAQPRCGGPPGRAGSSAPRPRRSRSARAPRRALAGRDPLGVRRRRRSGVLLARRAGRAPCRAPGADAAGLGGGDRSRRRRSPLLADRAVCLEPSRRLGIHVDRKREDRAGRVRRTHRPVAELACRRPAPRARRRRVGPAGRSCRAPLVSRCGQPAAEELEHLVRTRVVRVLHRPVPSCAPRPRPRLRSRPLRAGRAARRPARPGPGEGRGTLAG